LEIREYLIRRILFVIPVTFAVSILVFALMHAVGDPVQIMLANNPGISQDMIAHMESYYGLDKPVWYQYLIWLWDLVHLNWGDSIYFQTSVSTIVVNAFWESLKLQSVSLLLAVVVAIPVGVEAAAKQYSVTDTTAEILSVSGLSIPPFWLGLLLIIVFAFWIPLFPASGSSAPVPLQGLAGLVDELKHMVLPTFVLFVQFVALYVRLIRSSMLEILRQDYILAARASGLSRMRVLYRHGLRNALIPLVTYTGLYVGLSITSAPVTESVFSWPGLGFRFYFAVYRLDFPVIMAITMVMTLMVLGANLMTDFAYTIVDPRIKLK